MLDTVPEGIQKHQFLKALRESLRSAFALMDASTVPLTKIANRGLNLDHQQLGLELPLPRRPKRKPSSRQCNVHCACSLDIRTWNAFSVVRYARLARIPRQCANTTCCKKLLRALGFSWI
jgi:hypothetical protein